MTDATHTTLGEQVRDAIAGAASEDDASVEAHPDFVDAAADAVLVVFAARERELHEQTEQLGGQLRAMCAERERLLRERIEALPSLYGFAGATKLRRDVLAVFNES